MPEEHPVFTPARLGALELRNRVIRSAAFEGMCPGGVPSDELVAYHRRLAEGGVGMSTVAYASVEREGLTYGHQICLDRPGVEDGLRRVADAIREGGAASCIQIGHAGYFAAPYVTRSRPVGASSMLNLYGLSISRELGSAGISRLLDAFERGAAMVVEAGFDAVEVQAAHGYLLSQFLSPYTNRRSDRWGGSLENRLRFPLEVIRRVRRAVGDEHPVIVKMNLRDGFEGGLELEESVGIARAFAGEGVDALVPSGGFVSKVPMYVMRGDVPFEDMYRGQREIVKKVGLLLLGKVIVKAFPYRDLYFLDGARRIRAEVDVPLVVIGGVRTLEQMDGVVREGFEFVAMARPLVREPDLVARMRDGTALASTCEPCNRCVGAMDHGAVRCLDLEEKGG